MKLYVVFSESPMAAETGVSRSAWHGMLQRLGLDRPELRAWAMYDWANSAMVTTIVTAVFPIYFTAVAGADLAPELASGRYAIANAISLLIVALLAPVLGAIADYAGIKKKLLAVFLAIGIGATACMFLIQRGEWVLAAAIYIVAYVGAAGSFVFYDSLLPHLARSPQEMDRVSTSAYALGYLGGGILLALNFAWILMPQAFGLPSGENLSEPEKTLPTRLAFLSVAIWWLVFSIPMFRRVPEPAIRLESDERLGENPVRVALTRLRETFLALRGYRQAFLLLVAFLIYNDGIATIYKMATSYGTAIGIGRSALIAAVLLVQFVGIPFAILFGMLAGKIGAKRSIVLGLVVYAAISLVGYFMKTATHFFILATLVAMVQGGTQALSRSLFATMIPKEKSTEFFAFFAVAEKFAGIFGPAVFAVMPALTGSIRNAILAVALFFVVGSLLLYFVDVEQGQRAAQAADAATRTATNENTFHAT